MPRGRLTGTIGRTGITRRQGSDNQAHGGEGVGPHSGRRVRVRDRAGVLLRTPPASLRTSNIAARVVVEIGSNASTHGLGEVTSAEGGYMLERGPGTVEVPGVAFVRAARLPPPQEQNRSRS